VRPRDESKETTAEKRRRAEEKEEEIETTIETPSRSKSSMSC